MANDDCMCFIIRIWKFEVAEGLLTECGVINYLAHKCICFLIPATLEVTQLLYSLGFLLKLEAFKSFNFCSMEKETERGGGEREAWAQQPLFLAVWVAVTVPDSFLSRARKFSRFFSLRPTNFPDSFLWADSGPQIRERERDCSIIYFGLIMLCGAQEKIVSEGRRPTSFHPCIAYKSWCRESRFLYGSLMKPFLTYSSF